MLRRSSGTDGQTEKRTDQPVALMGCFTCGVQKTETGTPAHCGLHLGELATGPLRGAVQNSLGCYLKSGVIGLKIITRGMSVRHVCPRLAKLGCLKSKMAAGLGQFPKGNYLTLILTCPQSFMKIASNLQPVERPCRFSRWWPKIQDGHRVGSILERKLPYTNTNVSTKFHENCIKFTTRRVTTLFFKMSA